MLIFNSSLMFVQMICIRKGKVMNDFLVSFTNIITVALKNMLMVVNSKVHKRSLFSLLYMVAVRDYKSEFVDSNIHLQIKL